MPDFELPPQLASWPNPASRMQGSFAQIESPVACGPDREAGLGNRAIYFAHCIATDAALSDGLQGEVYRVPQGVTLEQAARRLNAAGTVASVLFGQRCDRQRHVAPAIKPRFSGLQNELAWGVHYVDQDAEPTVVDVSEAASSRDLELGRTTVFPVDGYVRAERDVILLPFPAPFGFEEPHSGMADMYPLRGGAMHAILTQPFVAMRPDGTTERPFPYDALSGMTLAELEDALRDRLHIPVVVPES